MLRHELDALGGGGVALVGESLVSLLLEILQNISDFSLRFLLPAEENSNLVSVAGLEDWIKQQGGSQLGFWCGGEKYRSSWTGRGGRGGGEV